MYLGKRDFVDHVSHVEPIGQFTYMIFLIFLCLSLSNNKHMLVASLPAFFHDPMRSTLVALFEDKRVTFPIENVGLGNITRLDKTVISLIFLMESRLGCNSKLTYYLTKFSWQDEVWLTSPVLVSIIPKVIYVCFLMEKQRVVD